jgi:hypothetical protein
VPNFRSAESVELSAMVNAPTYSATSVVTSMLARWGLRCVGCTFPSMRGSRPSRPIEKKYREAVL